MSCYTSPITGQPSVLAQLLDTNYGPMKRDRIMSYIYSDQFLKEHGDFRSPITKIPLDSIGKEPSFEWVESKLINLSAIDEQLPSAEVTFEMLNPQQKQAYNNTINFLSSPEQLRTLSGYAGTGKTSLTKFIVEDLKRKGINFKLASPTHRAKEVLQSSTNEPAMTVAKLLGLGPATELEDFNLVDKIFQPARPDAMPSGGIVIIDEASMINDDLFDYLTSLAARKGSKILFIGDDAQLKPVKQRTISKVFSVEGQDKLTEVMRTSNGNPMPSVVLQPIRDNQNSTRDMFPHTTMLSPFGEGIEFTKDIDTFLEKLSVSVKEMVESGNLMAVRAAAYTNKEVANLNSYIRAKMFGFGAPKFVEGELMMMYENRFFEVGDWKLPNGIDLLVSKVTRIENKKIKNPITNEYIILSGFKLDLQGAKEKEFRETVFVPDTVPKEYLIALNELKDRAIKAYSAADRAAAWKDFFSFDEKVFSINPYYLYNDNVLASPDDFINLLRQNNPSLSSKEIEKILNQHKFKDRTFNYGYAFTIHKSQGGTYDEVFVNEDDVDIASSFTNPDWQMINSLKYVGFSRSSKKTTVLSKKTDNTNAVIPETIYEKPTTPPPPPPPLSNLTEDEIEQQYQELEDKLDLSDYPLVSYLKEDYEDDSVSLLENTKYWISELEKFNSLKSQITEALQAGDNETALNLKKSLDSLTNTGEFNYITSWYEPDREQFRKSSDYIQEKVDVVKGDLESLKERLENERENLVNSLTAKQTDTELGVYEEFGTYYKFNTSPSGVITGEYRQGKDGEWKPLNNKTAQDKHERFVSPPQAPVQLTITQTTQPFTYSRTSDNSYEVSTAGDKRFSALNATLKDGRTIEEAYQLDVKGFRAEGNDWKLGKGKKPLRNITPEQSYEEYKSLWKQWAQENPELLEDLRQKAQGKVLTDKFASSPVSQARALAEILNETAPQQQTPPPPPPSVQTTEQIYSQLGDRTQSENIVIRPWGELKNATKAITSEGIVSTRIKGDVGWEEFGNPFTPSPEGKREGLTVVNSTKEAVESYIDFVINSLDPQAQWIREQLKSGKLKGKPILYYKELKEPSHATALDYLINKYDWNQPTAQQTVPPPPSTAPVPTGSTSLSTSKPGIVKPYPGVLNAPNSGLTLRQSNQFLSLLTPQITSQAYIENKAATANHMFSFGLRWARNIPNPGERSEQGKKLGTPRPNRKQINSREGMTYGYYETDQNNNPLPSIEVLRPIMNFIQSTIGIDLTHYDAMLGNIYEEGSFIHQHRDTTESLSAGKYPVVVMNLGSNGHLEYDATPGSTYGTYKKTDQLDLTNGGVYAFGVGGEERFTFHHRIGNHLESVNPLPPITLPDGRVLKDYRITLTFRRASDLTKEMPVEPTKVDITPRDLTNTASSIPINPLILPDSLTVTRRSEVTQANIDSMKSTLKLAFVMKAVQNPKEQFKVPWQNPSADKTVDNYGFNQSDYARIMDEIRMEMGDRFPSNLIFFPAFEFAMNNNPERLMKVYADKIKEFTAGRSALRINDLEMAKMTSKMEISITTPDGTVVDYFTKKHGSGAQEAVGSLMLTAFLDLYNKANGRVSAPHLIGQILLMAKGHSNLAGPNQSVWTDIVSSFTFKGDDAKLGLLDLLFENLAHLGYRIDYNSKVALKDYFFDKKNDPSFMQSNFEKTLNLEDSRDWERDYNDYLEDTIDLIEVDDMKAKTLRDWQDSAFERGSKDQATARLKLFIANQKLMESFSVGAVKYDPTDTTAIDLTDSLKSVDTMTLAQARQINGKKVMHKQFTPEYLEKAILAKFPRIPQKGLFGFPTIVPFDTLYENTQGVLSSIPGLESNISKAVELLRAEEDPNLTELADRLEKADGRNQREFIKVMNMQYNEFYVVNTNRRAKDNNNYSQSRVFAAQRYSQDQMIIERWKQSQVLAPIIKIRPNGERVIDVDRARVHAEVIKILSKLDRVDELTDESVIPYAMLLAQEVNKSPELQQFFSGINLVELVNEERVRTKLPKEAQRLQQKVLIAKMFAEHGIDLNSKVLDDLAAYYYKDGTRMDAVSNSLKNTKMRSSWIGQFSETESTGKPNGIFSAFFYAAAGMSNSKDIDSEVTEDLENSVIQNNPLYTESTTTKILAKFARKHVDKLFNAVHTNLEGKQIWDYSLPTSLSRAVLDLTTNHNNYTEKLKASVWGNNYYLKESRLSNLKLGYFEGLKVDNSQTGTIRQRMSDREQLLSSILFYQNQGRDTAFMVSLTHSDKTTTPVFSGIPKINVVSDEGGISTDVIEAFYTIFEGEWQRILQVQKLKKDQNTTGSKSMDTSGQHFLLLPSLNFESLSDAEKLVLFDEDGNVKSFLDETGVEFVKSKIGNYLNVIFDDAKAYWESNGITTDLLDSTYLAKAYKTLQGTVAQKAQMALDTAIADYAFNSTLWNMSSAVMLMGDPANTEWKGNVEKTMAEYTKRLAKDIAPRQQLMFERQSYSQLTVADVEMKYEYATKFGSNIQKSKATDAQEFTTVREHLDVMRAASKISDDMYKTLIDKVNKFNTKEQEDFTPEELAAMLEDGSGPMQPNKPIYAGVRFKNGLVHYDYIKSSSIPLLPQFTKNSELDKVRLLMEGKVPGVDRFSRLVFESGSKMGNSNDPLKLFSADGSFLEPTPESLMSNTRMLDRANFGIQQEVPFDMDKDEVNVITQMDKLIVEGILGMNNFTIGNQLGVSGSQVRAMKEDTRIKAARIKLRKLYEKLGVADNTKTIPASKVIKMLIEAARESEFSPNDIALLEDTLQTTTDGNEVEVSTYPLFFHSAVERFEKLILAKVKSITEFKMPGKSYVQVSSIGLIRQNNLSDKARLGVVTIGDFDMSKPLRHMQIDEVTGEVIPAQVIMPFNFMIDGKKVDIREYVIDGKLDLERIPRELLQLVGARIPNQGHNSMMAIEIVGFTPDWMGDAMIVPSAITGQMGSDFDVDKLYTYQRPYMYNNTTGKFETYQETNTNIGSSPEELNELENLANQRMEALGYKKNDDGSFPRREVRRTIEALAKERYGDEVPTHLIERGEKTLEELQQDYFNIHWGVLTHPEMYTKVMKSLDKGDLGFDKGAANEMFERKSEGPNMFFSPISQLKTFQSGKDAKDLVGMTSLSSTFDSNLQNRGLRLGTYIKDTKSGEVSEVEDSILLDGINLTRISGESLSQGYESKVNPDGTPDFSTWYSKHDNITIDQSGAVDNAKDRRLDNLNITMATYPAFDAMNKLHGDTRDGNRSVSKLFQCALSNQDILVEYTREYRKGNDSLSEEEEYSGDLRSTIVKSLREKYKKLYKELTGQDATWDDTNAVNLDMKTLRKAFKESQGQEALTPEYYLTQLKVLSTFDYLSSIGERLRELQKTLNQDTNGAGPNLLYVLQQLDNFDNLYKQNSTKLFLNEDTLVSGQMKELFEMTVPVAKNLLSSVFPVEAIKSVVGTVASYQGKSMSQLSLKTQKDIVRQMRSYTVSSSPAIAIDTTTERSRLLYGTNSIDSLAKRVERAKMINPDNTFLKRLDTKINTVGRGPDFVSTILQRSGRMTDNAVIQDFARLLQSDDQFLRELGEDLVNYGLTLTPQASSTSIVSKIPAGVILGTDIASQLRFEDTVLKAMGNMPKGYIDQLHQHMPSLATKVSKGIIKKGLSQYAIEGREYPEILALEVKHLKATEKAQLRTFKPTPIEEKFAPYLRFYSKEESRTILYKLVSEGNFLTYQRIDTLGKKGVVEYNSSVQGPVRSLFPENRAAFDYKGEEVLRSLEVAAENLINKTSDPNNAYSRWGITDGGQDVLTRGLEQLSADNSVPTYLRTISQALAETAEITSDLEARMSMNYALNPLTVKTTTSGGRGSYNAGSNTLSLRLNADVKKCAVVLLHETLHQRSSALLHALGWVSRERLKIQNSGMSEETFEKLWQEYQTKSLEFAKKNPEVYEKVKELDRLRLQAFEQLKAQLISQGIDMDAKMQDIFRDKLDGSKEDKLLYSLSSMSEFIAHNLTDSDMMEFLNTVESTTESSFIDRLIDSFLNFFSEMINALGINYNDKSILKECLALTYDITGLNNTERLQGIDENFAPQSVFADTESMANHLQNTIETVYNQNVVRTDNHLGHLLSIEEKFTPFTGGTEFFNDTINKLSRQLQQLDNTMARPVVTDEDRKRRDQALLIYNEAKEDYDKLSTSKDELEMMETATRQLEWVKNVVSKPSVHLQEVTIAWSILDTWGSMSDIYTTNYIPGDVINEIIQNVGGLATILSKQMLKQSMYSVITAGERQTNIKLTPEDLGINLKELGWLEKEVIALERDMNRASQMLTTFAQYQVQNAQSQFRDLTNTLKEFKKLVDPSDYSKFIQENEEGSVFGLVQELHPNWFKKTAGARYQLKSWLEGMYGLDMKDPLQRARRLDGAKAAYNAFWKDMLATGEVVRIDKLLDLATGDLRTDPEAQAEIARLKAASRENLVDDIIAKSQADYKKYLGLKAAKEEEIDNSEKTADFKLTPAEEIAYMAMSPADQLNFKLGTILTLTKAMKEQKKREWEYFNSPVNFLNTMPQANVSIDENLYLQNGRFKPWFVPKNIPENFDKKYDIINNNANLKKGYEILKGLSEQFRSYLPPTIAENLHENFLPIISPEMMAEASGTLSKLKQTGVGRTMLNAISSSRTETMKRDESGIPISYVNEAPRVIDSRGKKTKKIDMSKVSTDLPRMFEMFGEMAIHYNAMYPVGEIMDVAKRLVMEENKNRAAQGDKGLPNLVNLMKFYQDAVVYRKSKQLEGVDTTPIYSLNPMKHYARKTEMAGLVTELGKVNEEIILKRVDEDSDPKNPLLQRRKELEERIKLIQGEARYVTASKVGDSMISFQQLKSMSYNPFSAVSNLTFGYAATYLHARGFRADKDGFTTGDYTRQQLQQAYSMMKGNIANSWLKAFGYSHSDLSRKISALITRANAIEALIDTRFGGSNLTEDASNLKKFLDPTAAQKSGDWLTKGAVIVARALNTPVQVTVNGEVKTINLFEALNVEGEWDADKYGENKEWSSKNPSEQVAWNKYLFRTRKVMLLIFGNQDKNIPLSARSSVWGRLLGQFRLSWIPEGIKTRWGANQGYDEILERELEGRYRTMLRMPGFGLPLILKQMTSVVTGQDAFEGVKVTYTENGIEKTRDIKDFEKENMRRNMAGMAYTALFASIYYLLKGAIPDEEELRKLRRQGKNPATSSRIAANIAYRSFQDLILYASPDMFEQITGNVVPAWSVVSDFKKALYAWYKIASDDKYEWSDLGLKQTKALPFANLINKWEFYASHDISAAVR